MTAQPSVVLRHVTRTGAHLDWLIADPTRAADDARPLWTARLSVPPRHWQAIGRWTLEQIGHHRVRYLTHQGPIGGSRGSVLRLARGRVRPAIWTASRLVLWLDLPPAVGQVDLRRVGPARWVARWVGTAGLGGYHQRTHLSCA